MNEAMPIRLIIPDFAVVGALARGDLLDLLVKLDPDAVVVFTDIVAYEAMHEQDEEIAEQIGAFLYAHSHRIRIDTTVFGDLIESAKQDATIQMPQHSADMSIYEYLTDLELRHPGRRLLVILSDEWFRRNQAGPSSTGLTSFSDLLGLARSAGLLA